MGQTTIVAAKPYTFEGYFDVKGLFSYVNKTLEDLGYEVNEKEYEEASKGSKSIKAKFEAEMPLTDYFLSVIKYSLNVSGKPVTLEEGKKKINTYEGKATFIIEGILKEDFLEKVEKTPIGRFLSQLYNRYIALDERKEVEGRVKGDVKEVVSRFKQYLNTSA